MLIDSMWESKAVSADYLDGCGAASYGRRWEQIWGKSSFVVKSDRLTTYTGGCQFSPTLSIDDNVYLGALLCRVQITYLNHLADWLTHNRCSVSNSCFYYSWKHTENRSCGWN